MVGAETRDLDDTLGRIAIDRARILAPVIAAVMLWYAAADGLAARSEWISLGMDGLGGLALVWLSVLLWTRRVRDRVGHLVLAGIWLVGTSSSVVEEYLAHQQILGLLILIEMLFVAFFLSRRCAIACLALLDLAWLPVVLYHREPGWEGYVTGAFIANFLALVMQHVFVQAVASAERARRKEQEVAHALSGQLAELEASRRARESLSAQLAATQRLDAAGTLAASLAHEMNNILTGIVVTTSLLARKASERIRPELDAIQAESERGAQLTRAVLAFSRREHDSHRTQGIGALLDQAVVVIGRTLPPAVAVRTDSSTTAQVTCNAVQITQVLVNVALNGADAMDNEGSLELVADEVAISPDEAVVKDVRPGRFARLRVRDRGRGMDDETRLRAFDPFFTTKRLGNGTGLGLSIAWSIVRSHHGSIELESSPGSGTTVAIHLPVRGRDEA